MRSLPLKKSLLLGSCLGGVLFACSAEEGNKAPIHSDDTAGTTQGTSSSGYGVTTTTNGFGNTTGNTAGPTGSTPVTGSSTTTGGFGTTVGMGMGPGPGGTNTVSGPVTGTVGGVGGATSATVDGTVNTTGSGNCGITVDSYDLSPAIGTVGIVTWSASAPIESATIEFGRTSVGFELSAPVDLAEPGYKTLLLGMKGETEYSFQVHAVSGGQPCTSETYTIVTGPVANSIPSIMQPTANDGRTATGFIITSAGLGGLGFGGIGGNPGGGGAQPVFIFDMDGDPVWWSDAPASCSRAMMDWEGKNMWMMELNVDGGGGEVRRVSMDGTDVQTNVQGLSNAHHDLTVAPGGIVTTVIWTSGAESASDLVERSPDGTINTVVRLDSNVYNASGPGFHANSILYHPKDDSYTISDRYPNLYVKVSRTGQLQWQFGGSNPVGEFISGGSWQVNHGHHLLDDGTLLIFNNGMGASSPVIGYQLNADSSKMAEEVFRYAPSVSSPVLGDVQRLPNGNTLVTYSTAGVIHEVQGTNNLVQVFQTATLGYSMWRPTLYGPPPK